MLFWQKKSQLFFLSILLLAAFFVVEIKKVEAAFDPAVTYSKTSNGQLSADEWNNLQNDFVRTWGSTTAVGGIGIGVAPQGTDINGLVASSTIKTNTSFLGSLNASYITPGAFNSVAGTGGNFSFPVNLGIGTTPVNAGLHLSGADTYSAMFRLVNSSASGGQYFMGVTNSAWDAGGNKLVFGAGTPSSANIKMVLAANGNVGIGTTNPGQALHISGTSAQLEFTRTGATTADFRFIPGYSAISNTFSLYSNVAASYSWVVDANQNFLVPSGNLIISGTGNSSFSGNVGIGTTSPGAKLDVNGQTLIGSGNRTQQSFFPLYISDSSNLGWKVADSAGVAKFELYVGAAGINQMRLLGGVKLIGHNQDLTFGTTNNTSALTIQNNVSGNVGIGTTTPQYKLDVAGEGNFNGNYIHGVRGPVLGTDAANKSYVDSIAIPQSTTTAGIQAGFWTTGAGGSIYNNNSSGLVGIGTTNPGYKLEISGGDINIASNQYYRANGLPIMAYDSANARIRIGNTNVSDLAIVAGSATPRMFFNATTGNVGIGTTTPGEKLEVRGKLLINSESSANLFFYDDNGYSNNRITAFDRQDDGLFIREYQDNKTTVVGTTMSLLRGGNVGIGTTAPTQKLHVAGDASFMIGTSSPSVIHGVSTPVVGTDAVNRNYVDTNFAPIGGGASLWATSSAGTYNVGLGNVGIGTTAPGTRLQVAGSAIFGGTDGNGINISGTSEAIGLRLSSSASGYKEIQSFESEPLYINRLGNNVILNATAGNVGIGTTAPSQKLHVAGDASFMVGTSSPSQIHYVAAPTQGTDAVNRNYVDSNFIASTSLPTITNAFVQGGNSFGAKAILGTNDNQALGLETNGTEKMTILANGNVGIGTTDPGTSRLKVVGDVALQGNDIILGSGDTTFMRFPGAVPHYLYTSDAGSSLQMGTGGRVTDLVINPSGNVGIGTNNPGAYRLAVIGIANGIYSTNGRGNYNSLLVENNSGDFKGVLINHLTGAGSGACGGDGCYGFKFDDKRFNNLGGAAYGPSFVITRSGTTTISNLFQVDSHGINGLTVSDTSKVGVGTTTPVYKLDLAGDLNLNTYQIHNLGAPTTGTDAVNRNYVDTLISDSVSATDFWKLNGSNLYASSTAWNVGIGTTNPGGKLDVNGTFRLGELYYSDLQSITLPLGTETWLNLATIPNNGTVRFQIRTGSQNSEEITEIKVFGTYFVSQTGVTVERQSYNNHLKEVRVTGSDGGLKTVYIRMRTSSFAPTLTWRVIESKGAVTINNVEASPTGGLALLVNGNLSINTNVGMNIAGNVGIGTTTPINKLDVNGFLGILNGNSLRFYASGNGSWATMTFNGTTLNENYPLNLGAAPTSLTTTGNVGIGTTAPTQKLHVAGDASFMIGTSSPSVIHGVSTPVVGTDAVNRNYVDTNFAPIGGGASLWATSSAGTYNVGLGNVGIGTTNPLSKLSVYGAAGDFSQFSLANGSGYQVLNMGSVADTVGSFISNNAKYHSSYNFTPSYTSASGINFRQDGSTEFFNDTGLTSGTDYLPTKRMVISNTGNIGIGTTNPTAQLHIEPASGATKLKVVGGGASGTRYTGPFINLVRKGVYDDFGINFYTESTFNWFAGVPYAGGAPSANRFVIGTSATLGTSSVLTLLNNGNVGIATSAPAYKLDIAGDLNLNTYQIHNLGAPTTGTDAVNRNYVDTLISDSVSATDFWKLNGSNLYASSTDWNVGIGITSPREKLDISSALRVGADGKLTIYPTAGGSCPGCGTEAMSLQTTIDGRTVSDGLPYDSASRHVLALQPVFGNVGIGTTAPNEQLEITKNFRLPTTVGTDAYGVIYKDGNRFIHDFNYGDNGIVTTAGQNTFIGINAGNFTMGSTASAASHSSYNTGIGSRALYSNTTGTYNSAIGVYALYSNTTGYTNSAIGGDALYSNTTGYNNSAIGANALRSNTTGNNNSAIGVSAGRYLSNGTTGRETGNNGLYLGYNSKASDNGTNNEIVIGYNAIGKGSNTAAYGNSSMLKHIFEAGNVGIGTTTPTQKLHVAGDASFMVGTSSPSQIHGVAAPTQGTDAVNRNYVDSNFIASTSLPTITNAFVQGGNSFGTKAILGTNDNQALGLETNGTEKMTILANGNVGIGVASPNAKLVVYGGEGSFNAPNFGSANRGAIHIRNLSSDTRNAITFGPAGSDSVQAGIYVHQDNAAGTHMYFATTDNYSTGPQARLTIKNSGNVGIGTTSPGYKLDVNGSIGIAYKSNLAFRAVNGTSYKQINVDDGSDGYYTLRYISNGGDADSNVMHQWLTNKGGTYNTAVMSLTRGGNVGIAIATPGYKLDVLGDANFNGSQIHGVAIPTQGTDAVSKNYLTDTLATYPYYYLASRDTRAVADLPSDFGAGQGIKFDFKTNGSTIGLNDGGNYTGVMTWRKYGAAGDFSGGPSLQLAYTDNGNLWTRLSTSASAWGTWKQMLNSDTGVVLQPSTPGAQQTGNINISGTIIAGTISATGLTGTVNASNVTPGAFNSTLGTGGNYSFPASVGIGVTTPLSRLHVSTLSANNNALGQRWSYNGGDSSYYLDLKQTVTSGVVRWNFSQLNNGNVYDDVLVLDRGNVGIGTTDPGSFKLKVAGNVAITGTLQTMTGSDFAEEFTVSSPLEAGTVVVMGDLGYKSVKACGEKFDSTVVGVVSDNPSIIAGRVDSKHKVVVAMAGVVKVKVSDLGGKIKKGTMLTTSNISGYAMKADNNHPGTIIGKALENLSGQQGEIKVLINLQ